jgi:hypothetical protein
LSHKNAIKALQLCYFRFGGQKPLKFSEFLLLKKKNFASFASKLKILSHKNAIKALQLCYFRFGGQKPLKLTGFLLLKKKKFAFLLQN